MDALLSSSSEVQYSEDLFSQVDENLKTGVEPQPSITDSEIADNETELSVLPEARALVLADFSPPKVSLIERFIGLAYRLGVSGSTLSSPFRKPLAIRFLATPETKLMGDRAAGMSLRAGHFLIHGLKTPISDMEYESSVRSTPPFERVVHGFHWLRDLSAAGQPEQCAETAERIALLWLQANPKPGKCAAWFVDYTAQRLMAWLTHAPLLFSGTSGDFRPQMLAAIEVTAKWLDREVRRSPDPLGSVLGWGALTAAGLLLPQGKPRRIYAEAGLIGALGDFVGEDGGVLSRSPVAQMDVIAMLIDLVSCYRAVEEDPPASLSLMLELLMPPLLALRHSDGSMGNWQGTGAIKSDVLESLIEASEVRARPLKDVANWGYHRLLGGETVLQFDAAPPPREKHSRFGCASTLAFEMSNGVDRLIVNCGGAAFAGGRVPIRIEQGLRATAAHSTLILDDVNSTSVLLGGKLGKGVEQVEVERSGLTSENIPAQQIMASHNGYVSRFGLIHRRKLTLSEDGNQLDGEDQLEPLSRKGQRGKVSFAIRFHLGKELAATLSDDLYGANLAFPDGRCWQFRLEPNSADATVSIEESIWVDGDGHPHRSNQLVVQGMISRAGAHFSWLLKKMR